MCLQLTLQNSVKFTVRCVELKMLMRLQFTDFFVVHVFDFFNIFFDFFFFNEVTINCHLKVRSQLTVTN